jgi:hypothetical protein
VIARVPDPITGHVDIADAQRSVHVVEPPDEHRRGDTGEDLMADREARRPSSSRSTFISAEESDFIVHGTAIGGGWPARMRHPGKASAPAAMPQTKSRRPRPLSVARGERCDLGFMLGPTYSADNGAVKEFR